MISMATLQVYCRRYPAGRAGLRACQPGRRWSVACLRWPEKSVNAQAHLNNPSLMTELVTRLPLLLRLPWGQQVAQLGPTKVNLHNFSTWLSEVATALCFVIEPKQTPTASPLTGSALLAGNMTNFKKPFHQVDEIICVFCGKSGHYTDGCKRYRTLEDRRQQLMKQHRCYVCLSKRHTKAHCTTSRLCAHCKKLVATTAAFVQ